MHLERLELGVVIEVVLDERRDRPALRVHRLDEAEPVIEMQSNAWSEHSQELRMCNIRKYNVYAVTGGKTNWLRSILYSKSVTVL